MDDELTAVSSVLADVAYRPGGASRPIAVGRGDDGRLRLRSVDLAGAHRNTTTFSGDFHDEGNVVANALQHVAVSAATEAVMSVTYRGKQVYDHDVRGDPHVELPPDPANYDDRSLMLAKRRAREAHGAGVGAPNDPELDALDTHLAGVQMRWPGAIATGLWGERWADVVQPNGPGGLRYGVQGRRDGDLWICSQSGRMNTDTGAPFPKRDGRVMFFHPATPFSGNPHNRCDVLAAAARHIAWFAAHESLESATVDGRKLYDPHRSGEPIVILPGLSDVPVPPRA